MSADLLFVEPGGALWLLSPAIPAGPPARISATNLAPLFCSVPGGSRPP